MKSYKILGRFDGDAIAEQVPPDLRDRVRHAADPGVVYTAILFPHNREKGGVATSSLVRHALKGLEVEERVLAVGTDFTREATMLLQERGATIVRIGEFGWTDESYIGVRTPRA